ncbi:PIN domain-containing protein [Geoglobus acetivorans]|uniref:PIN domain-containing protein n=1 Tax=Geoglobus acetivorans TaxID=565033 RepID=A0ABZ3H5L1_GEOAI|nr:PIN domain-containing protein [Geoglobus acetivorans]
MIYVTDTHPLVWYLMDRLPENADRIFTSAEKGDAIIYIPTIVLAECMYLAESGRIEIDFEDLLGRLEVGRNFVPVSFNFKVLKLLPEVKLKELHDRIIVATARILDAKLITKDEEIRESGMVETVW